MTSKPTTRPTQLAARRSWAARNPEAARKSKRAWDKTPAGVAYRKNRQGKTNAYRKRWRERMRAKKLGLRCHDT